MVKATKDNRPFSSGVFDLEEFNIYTKVIDLPLDGIPTYLEEGINGVCTGGSALFNVFSNKRRVVKNDLNYFSLSVGKYNRNQYRLCRYFL